MAWNSLSEILSSCSEPGMQLLSTSGLLSASQTTSRLAASWTCPFIVIAIRVLHPHFSPPYKALAAHGESAFVPARYCSRGGWRQGCGQLLVGARRRAIARQPFEVAHD